MTQAIQVVLKLIFVLLALGAMGLSTDCRAASRNYDGLTVSIDDPLEGNSSYGYAAYRVTISNRSTQPHRVRIQLPANSYGYSYGDSIDRITRTVEVEPGVATRFELLQPPLPIEGHSAAVYIDGVRQRDDVNVNVQNHGGSYNQMHVVLVSRGIGAGIKDKIDQAIEDHASSGSTPSYGGGYGYGMGGYSHEAYVLARELRPVVEWDTSWLGYTRYVAVILSDSDFKAMPEGVVDALRSYVLTGGTLMILYGTDQPPDLSQWLQAWSPLRTAPEPTAGAWATDYGLGSIRMCPEATISGWNQKECLELLDRLRLAAESRFHRRDTERANRDLPVVEGQVTPARGLLLVMLLFTLTIGPANIVVLWLLKRPMLLLLTVPTIALVFSAAVMIYALISEGVTPHARTTALTLLDQRSHHAVSVGVHGYYAPLTPGNGLWFDTDTLITPQVETGYHYGSGSGRVRSIDQTHGQHLTAGWVTARVPAHLTVRKSEGRRERLDVSYSDDGVPVVVNGLGSDITQLTLVCPDQRLWTTRGLSIGQTVSLTPINEADLARYKLSVAVELRSDAWNGADRLASKPEEFLEPGSYLAELTGSPFVDPGIENLREHRTRCVVLGYFGEAP